MKALIYVSSLLLLSLEPATAAEPLAIPAPLALDWCLERARVANPTLEMADASASAAAHRARTAGTLDDPRFGYEASNVPTGDFDFDSTPLSGHQLGLRQKFPFPGVLSNRREAARKSAEAASLLLEDQHLEIDSAVEAAWATLGFAQQALDITRRNIVLLRQLAATAESRYRVGNGQQHDVLRAQVELTALLDEELGRSAAVERAEARLIALLDLDPQTRLPAAAPLAFVAVDPSLADVLEEARAGNPRLRAAERRVEQARHLVRSSELEGWPDFDLGVGYRVRKNVPGDPVEGDDFVSAGVTLRLPVDRAKWKSHVAESGARLREAKAARRRTHAAIAAQVRTAHAELLRASSEEELLTSGLIPQARQALEASRSAYEVGRIDFLGLLDSQVRLLRAELRLARARVDKRLAFAALEVASGEKLR